MVAEMIGDLFATRIDRTIEDVVKVDQTDDAVVRERRAR